jgi:O-methyltransferase
MTSGSPVAFLKATIRPLRRGLGRFLWVPDPEHTRIRALRETLFYKVGVLIAGGNIHGDYLEFGVYTGNSFGLAYQAIRQAFIDTSTPNTWNSDPVCVLRRQLWNSMRFVAFDSFEGLPEPKGDDAYTGVFVKGELRSSELHFRQNVREAGVPDRQLAVVTGFFDRTLNDQTIERTQLRTAAIVHVDCDLYESTRLVLAFVTPLLVDGSIIIFDDWFQFRGRPDMGEQRAFHEWSEANPDILLTEYSKWGPWANSFVVNTRRARSGAEAK